MSISANYGPAADKKQGVDVIRVGPKLEYLRVQHA